MRLQCENAECGIWEELDPKEHLRLRREYEAAYPTSAQSSVVSLQWRCPGCRQLQTSTMLESEAWAYESPQLYNATHAMPARFASSAFL